jgi:ABC-2 type transport system permease protein
MNTQSNTMPEPLGAQRVAPAPIAPTQVLLWSLRRELWENRSIYLAPVAVAGVFLLAFMITLVHLPAKMRALSGLDPMHFRHAVAVHYDLGAGLMMATSILVSVFYCLDALHSERRDRSILFWKSLPVSDGMTVLAKAIIPFVILPVLAAVVGAALQFMMLLLSSVVLLGSGQSVAALWRQLPVIPMALLLLYHLLTAHALWPAPIYCWLMLVSGWARRAVFLWATLPLLVIGALEQILFHTSRFLIMVGHRFIGDAGATTITSDEIFPTNPMTHITPGTFLSSSGLWIGLAVAAVFLVVAVRLRRSAGPT